MSRVLRLPLILAAAGGVLVLCAVSWRTGHAQRAWCILWEGDKKGRAKSRNNRNVAAAREFIDDVEARVADLEGQEFGTADSQGRPSRAAFRELVASLSNDVDEALKFLDKVNGDDGEVRRARKEQVSRLVALGDRIDEMEKAFLRGG